MNLQLIDNRNALEEANGGEPVHGLTHLVDMSQDEYERLMLSDKTAVPSAVATEVSMIDEDRWVHARARTHTPVRTW